MLRLLLGLLGRGRGIGRLGAAGASTIPVPLLPAIFLPLAQASPMVKLGGVVMRLRMQRGCSRYMWWHRVSAGKPAFDTGAFLHVWPPCGGHGQATGVGVREILAKAWTAMSTDVVSSLEASFWYMSCPAGYFAGENLPLLGL